MPDHSVAFYTLGCKLNYSESSSLSRLMNDHGFEIKQFHETAEIYVINTCSVTENADHKCRRIVRQALKKTPGARVVIIGCYAQLKPKEIAEIPGVDLVLGAAEKFNLPAHLDDLLKNEKQPTGQFISSPVQEANIFIPAYSLGERTRTFLKVQDGCDYSCSFCTIPLARGASRSDTIDNVVRQARAIAEKGIAEIVLTGVNIGDFGKNNSETKETFFDLITALDTTEGISRFRISSIEPNLLQDKIIHFVSTSDKFVPHFHIPLQSGSNKILKLMRRRYVRELYAERIATIKKLMPHCGIGVDVITGFPGETENDFLETYHFLNGLDISYLHVFTYSERDHTDAVALPGKVPQQIREDRTAQLISLSVKKRRHFYMQHEGTRRPVLFEAETDGAFMYGFTDNYIRVKTHFDPLLVNEVVEAALQTDTNGMEMIAADAGELIAYNH